MKDTRYLKPVMPVVIGLFTVLLLGAVFFYKERMLFIDAPHILFRIINLHRLDIQVGRYGAFITQIFPLIGVWLHLPVKAIMLLYSVSFVLYPFTVALLFIYKYKRYDLALLLGLYFTLFVSDTFFWTNNEVHQGITWLLLGFAITGYMKEKGRLFILIAIVFAAFFLLAIITHPLVMFAAVYLWVFYLVSGQQWQFSKKESLWLSILLLAVVFIKYKQSEGNWYDGGMVEKLKAFPLKNLWNIFHSPQIMFFAKNCVTNYWLFVAFTVTGLMYLLKEKKYLLFFWTIISLIGCYTLLCILYWDVNANRFYMESEYMPLTIIGVAPFIYYALKNAGAKLMVILFIIIFTIRMGYIVAAAEKFRTRERLIEHIDNKLQVMNLHKVIIVDSSKTANRVMIQTWAVPVETALFSAMNNDHVQTTCAFSDTGHTNTQLLGKDTLMSSYGKINFRAINTGYFVFDTLNFYTVVSYSEVEK